MGSKKKEAILSFQEEREEALKLLEKWMNELESTEKVQLKGSREIEETESRRTLRESNEKV